MKKLFILLFFASVHAVSCEMEIPIEVEWEFGKIPTETDVGYLLIKAPLKYKGWSVGGVQFKKGKNRIPIMKYVSEEEFPGMAVFQVTTTSEFIDGGKFIASYIPDPVVQKDGTVTGTLCLHTQEVEVKI